MVLEEKDLQASGHKPTLRVVGGHGGELFVADITSPTPRTLIFSTAAKPLPLLRTLPVRTWSFASLPDGRCVAALDYALVVLDIENGQTTPFTTENLAAPWCVAVDARGRVFVSDQGGSGIYTNVPQSELWWRYLREKNKAADQIRRSSTTLAGCCAHSVNPVGNHRV